MQSGQMPTGTPNQAWTSLDLLLLLSQLYDNGHAPAVHEILELPQAQCPDLLVLTMASALRCLPISVDCHWLARILFSLQH